MLLKNELTEEQINYYRKCLANPNYIASAIDFISGVEADNFLADVVCREGFKNDRKRNKKL